MNLRKSTGAERSKIAPPDEQSICITCGFCCDGTMFLYANLDPGESGHLPEKIELNRFVMNEKEYFRQPCLYFADKCSIYDKKRANICSGYRCQLLRDYSGGRVSLNESLDIIREAAEMRDELINQYKKLSGIGEQISFRQLLLNLGKITVIGPNESLYSSESDLLQAKCNILETLLIRHIRSSSDFEAMQLSPDDKR
jgi:hypothetical protein